MQQHTGQHVLSAAIDRVCGVRTESFHLGADTATIDLARELTVAEIAASEDAANEVVWPICRSPSSSPTPRTPRP